ncbi:hypothetical protein [Paenibacillus senegalimassiliensis]|uniref:hypothetical protein n=1 Tax=Paenibacillus senegalimassiliensis TaxID=1737426 RepID=UPI00073E8E5C|nr:hypothetical protein [Paenibacillus senegalimassiliensis]
MLSTDNEIQRTGIWGAEIYISKDCTPLKIGFVFVNEPAVEVSVIFESFIRDYSNESREGLDNQIKQLLIQRGVVKKVEV